jgi:serine/threonine-protein kinase RsbW
MEVAMNESAPRRCEFDPDGLALRLDMTVPGSVTEIQPVVDKIMAIIHETGCAAGHEFELEVAVLEALANAVRHGCGEDPSKQVEICVECDETKGMLIIVRDPGKGFDPANLPNPVVGENLYADGGRGVYLINRLMDEVRFERGGTEIWMRKHPPEEGP